jgi:hypothetical protein
MFHAALKAVSFTAPVAIGIAVCIDR